MSQVLNEQEPRLGWGPGEVRDRPLEEEEEGHWHRNSEPPLCWSGPCSHRPSLERQPHPPSLCTPRLFQPVLTQPLTNGHSGASWVGLGRRKTRPQGRGQGRQGSQRGRSLTRAGRRLVSFAPPTGCHSPGPFYGEAPTGSATRASLLPSLGFSFPTCEMRMVAPAQSPRAPGHRLFYPGSQETPTPPRPRPLSSLLPLVPTVPSRTAADRRPRELTGLSADSPVGLQQQQHSTCRAPAATHSQRFNLPTALGGRWPRRPLSQMRELRWSDSSRVAVPATGGTGCEPRGWLRSLSPRPSLSVRVLGPHPQHGDPAAPWEQL